MRVRTTRFLGATAIAAGACLLVTGTANAVEGPNGAPETIAAAGSDTTQDITDAILNSENTAAWNTDPDQFVNVPPTLPPGGSSFTVPADSYASAFSYCNPAVTDCPLPPNGSSQGKAALRASAEAGDAKIDIARSSSGPSSSDPAEFEYYGFARDAVSWSASSTGSAAGVTLTLDELRAIYRGEITNWTDVADPDADDAPIVLYLPQTGSGTLSFFTGTVLGFDPATIPGLTIKRHQEHVVEDPAGVDLEIDPADRPNAIAAFSVAQWIAQGNGVVNDKRADFTIGALTGAGSDTDPLVSGSAGNYSPTFNNAFLGARVVYHVLHTGSQAYQQAKNAVGFDDAGPSPLCDGQYASTLNLYGFKPLPVVDGVTCTLL